MIPPALKIAERTRLMTHGGAFAPRNRDASLFLCGNGCVPTCMSALTWDSRATSLVALLWSRPLGKSGREHRTLRITDGSVPLEAPPNAHRDEFQGETLLRDYKGHQALFTEQGAFAFARCRSKTHGRNVLSAWQGWRVDCFLFVAAARKRVSSSVIKTTTADDRHELPTAGAHVTNENESELHISARVFTSFEVPHCVDFRSTTWRSCCW